MTISSGTWRTRVRLYECDALGHVNNAWYLAYLQQATHELWAGLAPAHWQLRRLAIEYLSPAQADDELEVSAWPASCADGRVVCGYEVRRTRDGQPVVRALIGWEWLDSVTGQPLPLPASWPTGQPAGCTPARPLRLGPDRLDGRPYRWRHTVRSYEAGANGRVNPSEILRWLEEAKFVACAEVGWPPPRIHEAGILIVQVRHDSEVYQDLAPGDAVEIVSRVYEMSRVKGSWRQELYRNGELAALDYGAGAFLNRAGHPSPPPAALVEALVRGKAR